MTRPLRYNIYEDLSSPNSGPYKGAELEIVNITGEHVMARMAMDAIPLKNRQLRIGNTGKYPSYTITVDAALIKNDLVVPGKSYDILIVPAAEKGTEYVVMKRDEQGNLLDAQGNIIVPKGNGPAIESGSAVGQPVVLRRMRIHEDS